MAKMDVKKLMADHGEKIGAGAAAVGLLGLIAWGGMMAASAQNPTEIKNGIDQLTNGVSQRIQNNARREAPPLEAWVDTGMKFPTLAYADHPANTPLFDILLRDDGKRRNPTVYGPTEFQVDVTRFAIPGNDVMIGTGRDADTKVAVLIEKEIQQNRQEALRRRNSQKAKTLRRVPTPVPGTSPFAPGGAGMPGGVPGGPPPGMPGPAGGQLVARGQYVNSRYRPVPRTETTIEYVSIDKVEKDPAKYQLAEVLMPVRMVVVTANFPYKQQFEELARALRFPTLEEMMADQTVGLKFNGFEVMRQVRDTVTGKVVAKWQPYNWEAGLGAVLARAVDAYPDAPDVQQLILPADNQMAAPLPKPSKGEYPPVKLKTIADTVETLRKKFNATLPAFQESEFTRKLRGKGGVFDLAPGTPGQPGAGPPGAEMMRRGPAGRPEVPGATGQMSAVDQLPDYCLLRFVDTDVEPGYSYEYQVRVKIANPNYKRYDLVGRPSYAEMEEVVGQWVQVPQPAAVTDEAYLYVSDDRATPDRRTPVGPGGDTAVVEMQRWFEAVTVSADDKRGEPVGDWVVAKLPVKVGEYIGGRVPIELPLWSPTQGQYLIRSLAPVSRSRPAAAQQTGGVSVNLSTGSVLVATEGGTGRYPMPRNPKAPAVEDEAGLEVLLLTPDGKLWAYNSAKQREDADRKARQEGWDKWIADVKQLGVGQQGTPGAADPFAPKR